jgi:hypothetical protein
MVSLERARELLKDASLTDHEVKEVRDVLRLLAEVIFDKWQNERRVREARKSEDINKNRPDT